MGKFVAIGGGENRHHNTKYETAPFDKEIIKLTGKTNPNFLFIGLANSYPDYYFEVMDKIYNAMYGCNTDYLRYDDIKNQNTARSKIKIADIIYVGGGNTAKLMRLLRKYGIDKMLVEAYNDDKVLCGVSAGGICWRDWGNSDSEINSSKNRMIRVKGLGLIHILFAPHIVTEPNRAESVKQMMKRTYKVSAIELDNAALEIVDNQYRILTNNNNNSVAQKCYWKNGEFVTENIMSDEFKDIEKLYEKC